MSETGTMAGKQNPLLYVTETLNELRLRAWHRSCACWEASRNRCACLTGAR